ncbi:cytochrome P450 family protein [Streptomyces candidus]|uniref:Cytochrome P450 n=1 Tax=Streptomyces candidus TaxID=67283 RepID=A0A7X0LMX4_9ACTN|nr:cytochrome P450 [Streptomyces candidus]MBB6434310.1 cytochrome P450 [Streptomyces candidus]GHH37141.1 cytochrome P450 [Streptomyces candidus]
MTAPQQDPLRDPRFFADPYPTYDRLRESCPVRRIPTGSGGHQAYLITGHPEAREAFTDPRLSKDTARFFADRPSNRDLHPAISRNMLASDPPAHSRHRRVATPLFTTGRVRALRPYITRVVEDLVAAWRPGADVDLVAELAVPLPVTVVCELLGVPESDRSRLARWSQDLFDATDTDRVDAASHRIGEYLTRLVDTARADSGDGALHSLLRDCDEGGLDRDETVSLAALLLVAGHETTTHFIGNAVLALLRHPDAFHRLCRNPDLIPGALDELLRFDSPVSVATFRHSTQDLCVGGVDIPAGFPVLIAPGAANRDPAAFPDPHRLDLDRDAGGHLSFGHGIHRCPGAPLARAEVEIALRTLVSRFPNARLAVPEESLTWRRTRLTRGLSMLPLKLG